MNGAAFDSVILDLDGTLVNSLPGIEASARHALETVLPGRPLPHLREVIGPPIAAMFAKVLPDLEPAVLDALVASFREHYDSQGCLLAELYPGVAATLANLHRDGLRLFVLTNKPLKPTLRILEQAGVLPLFTHVSSPDFAVPSFQSKTEAALALRDRFQPGRTLLAGDGVDDARAASACGFAFAMVEYGYGGAFADRSIAKVASLQEFPEIERIVFPGKVSL